MSTRLYPAQMASAMRPILINTIMQRLGAARGALPDQPWFAPDGMHPGSELTLMDALLLYERIQGRRPAAIALTVASNGKTGSIEYASEQVRRLIEQLW